jgi:hypothetical protein
MTDKELKKILLGFINQNYSRFVWLCKQEGVDGDEVLKGLEVGDDNSDKS